MEGKDKDMEFQQIIELIKTVSDSKLTSFSYEKEDKNNPQIFEKISIKKDGGKMPQVQVAGIPQTVVQSQAISQLSEEEAVLKDENVKIVTSPLVGTFYSAASPEDEPFVKVGDKVSKGQKLGIIEAMKLMNDIESDYDGEIIEIMVSNENMVEYGQPLFKIK